MNESPQQKVARLVEKQVEVRRRDGVVADVPALTAVTTKLLSLADAEMRTGATTRQDRDGKSGAEVRAKKRETSGEALADAMGGEFYFRELGDQPIVAAKPAAKMPTGVDAERHIALLRRISMLVAKVPGYIRKPRESAYAGHQYPMFAQLLDWNQRRAALTNPSPLAGTGRYEGLSQEDRARVFFAELEKICNRSDAVIRPGWWCPK